jgi:hypothetical protein
MCLINGSWDTVDWHIGYSSTDDLLCCFLCDTAVLDDLLCCFLCDTAVLMICCAVSCVIQQYWWLVVLFLVWYSSTDDWLCCFLCDTAVLMICCAVSCVSVALCVIADVTLVTSLRVGSGPWVCSFSCEISSSPQVLALAGHLTQCLLSHFQTTAPLVRSFWQITLVSQLLLALLVITNSIAHSKFYSLLLLHNMTSLE